MMDEFVDEFIKRREVQFEELKTMMMEFKQRQEQEAILLMMTEKSEEVLQHQEQQLSNNDDTENIGLKLYINDNWSAGSERTCYTEPMDSDEREQAITTIEMIDGRKKGNKEKRINKCIENRIATVRFLDLRASLEDPDDHKEKPLTCDMEPDIYRAQKWKLVYGRKRKKKTTKKKPG